MRWYSLTFTSYLCSQKLLLMSKNALILPFQILLHSFTNGACIWTITLYLLSLHIVARKPSINLVAYVQYKIDNILRHIYAWTRVYVNDIIYRAKFLADLLEKLYILFNIFFHYNISIKSIKFFFNYSHIRFLGQQVNSLGLTTLEEKLRAIKLLTYPKMLSTLEYYLRLISYLCNYLYYYAQLATFLQALKTFLLQDALISKQ